MARVQECKSGKSGQAGVADASVLRIGAFMFAIVQRASLQTIRLSVDDDF